MILISVVATGFDETNSAGKPVEMLIGDNRNKKVVASEETEKNIHETEQPKVAPAKRQPFGGESVEMIPNWLMNRYK